VHQADEEQDGQPPHVVRQKGLVVVAGPEQLHRKPNAEQQRKQRVEFAFHQEVGQEGGDVVGRRERQRRACLGVQEPRTP
jgi:hypothetical protein